MGLHGGQSDVCRVDPSHKLVATAVDPCDKTQIFLATKIARSKNELLVAIFQLKLALLAANNPNKKTNRLSVQDRSIYGEIDESTKLMDSHNF